MDASQDVRLLKIDVEGDETRVLEGARRILREQKPALFVESPTTESTQRIDSILQPIGYRRLDRFNPTPTYYYAHAEASIRT